MSDSGSSSTPSGKKFSVHAEAFFATAHTFSMVWCDNHKESRPKKNGKYVPRKDNPMRAQWLCGECVAKLDLVA
jgi:hypothetical protein